MSNSKLVEYTKLSPNHSGQRTMAVDRITPHSVVGQCTIEGLGDLFYKKSRKASSNYGIDKDGRVGLFVDENNRSWCSSSNANDQRAITIECASDTVEPYTFNTVVYNKLIELCVDICKRYKKTKLIWIEDKATALKYVCKDNEMLLTVHRWFGATTCPNTWMMNHMKDLASKVTKKLTGTTTTTPTETYRTYTVKTGDTLWTIAIRYLGNGNRYKEIMTLNNLKSTMIYTGNILKIPNK